MVEVDMLENSRGHRRGFTLIELLVVIAIIAILASILFPVFLNVKERARQNKCCSNLRQLALAVTEYTFDYNGRFPNPRIFVSSPSWEGCTGTGNWIYLEKGQLWKYVRNAAVYACPTDARRPALQYATGTSALAVWAKYNYPLSYSMNCDFVNAGTKQTLCMDVVRRTKDVLLLIHESRSTINDGDFNWRAGSTSDVPSDVHYDGTTLVYLDGHAVWHSATLLKQQKNSLLWDPTR